MAAVSARIKEFNSANYQVPVKDDMGLLTLAVDLLNFVVSSEASSVAIRVWICTRRPNSGLRPHESMVGL